jgi:hypothetical protein
MTDTAEFFEEYDGLVEDVLRSDHRFFASNLTVWLGLLDRTDWVAEELNRLPAFDLQAWLQAGQATRGSMVGSGRLNWPADPLQSLALRLALFRAFADQSLSVQSFAISFLYSANNFNTMVNDIGEQLFRPFQAALRRHLDRVTRRLT